MRKTSLKIWNNSKTVWVISIILIGATFFYSPYFSLHFSNDDYYQEAMPVEGFAAQASSQGRPLLSILIIFAEFTGFNLVTHQQFLWPLVLFLYTIATYFLYDIIRKNSILSKVEVITLLGVLSLLLTWGFVDMQTYASMNLTYSLAYFFCMLAVYAFSMSGRLGISISIAALTFSLFFYQGFASYFPVMIILLGIVNGLTLFKLVCRVILSIVVYISAYFVDWLWIKLVHPHVPLLSHWTDNRTGSIDIIDNIGNVFYGIKNIITGYGLIPDYVLPIITAIAIVFPIIINIYSLKERILFVLQNCIFVLFVIFVASLPHFFTSSVSYSLRSAIILTTIPSLLGILNLYYDASGSQNFGKSNRLYLIIVLFFGMITLSYVQMQKYGKDLIVLNHIDTVVGQQFADMILDYEIQTGQKVIDVYFINDEDPYGCYKEYDVNCGNGILYLKAFAVPWSNIFPINKAIGREFEIHVDNEEYDRLIYKTNFDHINTEKQIHFEGSNAIITVF